MKSRISLCNGTILKKDLTRFAPVWLSLCAYLAIWASTIFTGGEKLGYYYEPTAPIFAPILALVVFGYLCDPTECVAVHSLPIRRERLFLIHTAASCIMFLIPTALFCFVTRNAATQGAFYRFLFTGVEFLFLFSIGVLCMMLTGRKVGAALLFLFIQFIPAILGGFINDFYLSCLPGVYLGSEYYELSPVRIVSNYADFMHETTISNTAWIFTAVITAVSVGILALSMLLYRRRKLECAGDFMAIRGIEPVFLTVYTLVVGCVFQMIFGTFTGNDIGFSLFVGLFVGFFTGRMLLKRTVRVFQWKAWGKCGILIGIFLLTLLLTWLDPLGIQTWIPNADNVTSIQVHASHSPYPNSGETFTVEDVEDIEKMLQVHALLIDKGAEDEIVTLAPTIVGEDLTPFKNYSKPVSLTYTLKNGRTVSRYYYVTVKSEAGQILRPYFASLSCVLGVEADQMEDLVQKLGTILVDGYRIALDDQERLQLLEAIAADCEAGTMIQLWGYRRAEGTAGDNSYYIEFTDRTGFHFCYIDVTEYCENTNRFMTEHNIGTPNYDEKFG